MIEAVEEYLTELGLTGGQITAIKVGVVLVAVAAVLSVLRMILHFVRGLRPVTLNPKLQKYGGEDDPNVRRRRLLAGQILSTSSTEQIPGFRIVQAVDAIYVDGFRTPAEALEGLKATAAERGANAVTNVRHERTSMGRCAASGDAVLVEPVAVRPVEPPRPPQDEDPAEPPLDLPPPKPRPRRGQEPGGPMIR